MMRRRYRTNTVGIEKRAKWSITKDSHGGGSKIEPLFSHARPQATESMKRSQINKRSTHPPLAGPQAAEAMD
jgi:hypothetical protein